MGDVAKAAVNPIGAFGGMLNQTQGASMGVNPYAGIDPNSMARIAGNNADNISAGNVNDPNAATNQVMNNGVLGGLFGQGGQLQQAENQVTDLTNNGFNLNNTDKTAYGEAAGNIARQFGQNDQSLSQSLANRGLSNSGIAGQEFSNSLGNKNEQLAGLQTQIAQNRMQMNQQRLAQTQNFMAQLGQQGQNAIQGQFGRNLQGQQFANDVNQQKFSNAMGVLGAQAGQGNEQFSQYQQSQRPGDFATGLSGALAIGGTAGKMMAGGPAAGAAGGVGTSAGQSSLNAGRIG